ncbi:PREDICTED: lipid phosphate phosphatase epsilon 1, chloroplastic [Prunus mume]|uniref:Lipid phosphate phosphatase epsilon 1, chloroplastic n=1 Tax=Prunus mume TaxID=102107 RepID=A0ABM0PMG6_PRUMU|nr:PREDICTED: lipid phosphate phosphatase epsilon 1, chloroplastic [Prunus mume]
MSSAAAAATNFHQPNLELFTCRSCTFKSLKPISSLLFPTSKFVFSGGLLLAPNKAVSGRRSRAMGPNSGVELIKMPPFRNPDDDDDDGEGVGLFQRDDYVDGPSELSPLIVDKGWESTLNRLSKWIVSALFAVVILWRHDAEAMWAAMGSVANTILSAALKKILNQERPVPSLRSEPGMPSSHAQSIFYIVLFTIWSVVEWLGINEITLTIGAFTLATGIYLSWLRVSQKLHTLSQVVVGATFGTIFSILWLLLWNAFVHKAFISSLWIRIVIALGAAGFCLGFVVYVIRHWLRDER